MMCKLCCPECYYQVREERIFVQTEMIFCFKILISSRSDGQVAGKYHLQRN